MSEIMNGKDGLALLNAVGFAPYPGKDGLELTCAWEESLEGGPAVATIVVTGPDRSPVTDATAAYQAVATHDAPGTKAIEIDCADARDVMAFAVAIKNDLIAMVGDHSKIPVEDTFEAEGCSIHNPFQAGDYADWALDKKPSATSIHLKSPSENYGSEYVAWRNGRAVQFLPTLEPGPRALDRSQIAMLVDFEEGDAAFTYLQALMGVTDGGLAALWFDGDNCRSLGKLVADAFLAHGSKPVDLGPVAEPLPEPDSGDAPVGPSGITDSHLTAAADAFTRRLETRFSSKLDRIDRDWLVQRVSKMMRGYVQTEANFAATSTLGA